MQDLWRFALQTTALGMGVVFVALFLLSVYMHFFKEFTGRIEGRRRGGRRGPVPVPKVEPVPEEGGPQAVVRAHPPEAADASPVAAAVAVALALEGRTGVPAPEVAAAVAAALALHRARIGPSPEPVAPCRPPAWRMAGRLEAMAGRLARQERARR